MNKNTKKILWLVAIAAVIILYIAWKKKQEKQKENEGDEEGAKNPYIGTVESQNKQLPYDYIEGGRGPAVRTVPTITVQESPIQPISTAKDVRKKFIPSQIEIDVVTEKSVNYFDANCK